MLEQAASMFDGMQTMMKKLKKASYEVHMKEFRRTYGDMIREMTDHTGAGEDKRRAAGDVADAFIDSVRRRFEKNGKISGTVQVDLNFFMIYYVFPAILLTEHEDAKIVADVLCEKWGEAFKNSKIGYTDYASLHKSFREKIFGIF